jgi:hypothetical protein
MYKIGALRVLLRDFNSERRTKSAMERDWKALKVLGFERDEALEAMVWFDYARPDGTPYLQGFKPPWERK